MIVWLRHLLGWIVSSFRSREDLLLENLALRRQLLALHASTAPPPYLPVPPVAASRLAATGCGYLIPLPGLHEFVPAVVVFGGQKVRVARNLAVFPHAHSRRWDSVDAVVPLAE
jgi:hypothetical protein